MYQLQAIYAAEMTYRAVASEDITEDKKRFSLNWDWRYVPEEPGVFEVKIGGGISATPSEPREASVQLVGRFRRQGVGHAISIPEFARSNAPVILMPYVRQYLSDLTLRGLGAALLLPPINVMRMMEGMKQEATTAARQVAGGFDADPDAQDLLALPAEPSAKGSAKPAATRRRKASKPSRS